MDTSTLILVVALVLAVAIGPPVGFVLARRRLERKLQGRMDRSNRFSDLDAQVRSLSGPEPPGPGIGFRGTPAVTAPGADRPAFDRPAFDRRAAEPLPVPAELHASGAGRFVHDPPTFDASPPGPPPAARPPAVTVQAADRPEARPDAATTGPSAHSSDGSAPTRAAGEVTESPKFRPIADHVEDAVKLRLSWLHQVPTGRLLALHRLGYDDPVKIANLRPVEVSRLARALHVAEQEIEEEWMPAARRELGMRRFGA